MRAERFAQLKYLPNDHALSPQLLIRALQGFDDEKAARNHFLPIDDRSIIFLIQSRVTPLESRAATPYNTNDHSHPIERVDDAGRLGLNVARVCVSRAGAQASLPRREEI